MRPHDLAKCLLPLILCACGEAGADAVLSPAFAAVSGPCVEYQGEAQPVGASQKLFQADLTGDLTGTLRIVPTRSWLTGVVEHEEGIFVLDRESGEVVFGDGVRGRRLPTGPPASGRARYQASGPVTQRAAGPEETPRPARGWLSLGGHLSPDPAASSLRYRLSLCEGAAAPE